LDGTWKTSGPAIFYVKTAWPSDSLQDVGYEMRNVTFVITGTWDPSTVDMTMSYEVASSTVLWDSFYTPDATPDHYSGIWNGTALTLMQGDVKAVFSVTDLTITGTWDDLVKGDLFSQ
jgi:hypothetical protein